MIRRLIPVVAASATVAAGLAVLATGVAAGGAAASASIASTASTARGTGSYVLTATSPHGDYAPTFTGNGYLGVRVPATGQGYAGGSVPSQSEVAGFYARPPGRKQIQQRASVPTWSTLRFTVGGHSFSLHDGSISRWRQQIDLHTGTISTQARWTAPDGRVTDLRYTVFTDRARPYVASVRLVATPHWTGTAQVTDLIDGKPADLTKQVHKAYRLKEHQVFETVRTVGTGLVAGLASSVQVAPSSAAGADHAVARHVDQSVGQRIDVAMHRGQTSTITKDVGVVTSQVTAHPASYARAQSTSAATAGYPSLVRENATAWRALWAGRIDIRGNDSLATEVNASEFYLWSNTRPGVDWSISPAGLSSDGYAGHIFWDAETWMYPSLLAQHPDLAAGMNAYRYQRLRVAEQHARQTGYRGARFPWESALDGTEQTPPPFSVNSEGRYEQHITADVALAQWQYYLTTYDVGWLRSRGWPVLQQTARFWASRAVQGPGGRYHIRHVTGPDEENPDVNDEAYTNVGAATTLRNATAAAHVLGLPAPAAWTRIADRLVVPHDSVTQIHPEFAGYRGQLVKQADVTMLQYPWRHSMPDQVARHDLDFYVPRTDPLGPSMTDAISSIDTAALGTPGCASYVYTRRSADPFIRDMFDQFSETSTGGAFTFITGIGGFLQEFLYGYSGMRWDASAVQLDPSLTKQIGGVILHRVSWRGRTFTVDIGPRQTTVTLESGAPLPVQVRGHRTSVAMGSPLVVSTRRPDLVRTNNPLRCQPATATSAEPLGPALAAVDGSRATYWQPQSTTGALTVPLTSQQRLRQVDVVWGRHWPPAPAPNVPPPPRPVHVLRASSYDVLVSTDGSTWHVVDRVRDQTSGRHDVLRFAPTSARFVRIHILAATHHTAPKVQSLNVS